MPLLPRRPRTARAHRLRRLVAPLAVLSAIATACEPPPPVPAKGSPPPTTRPTVTSTTTPPPSGGAGRTVATDLDTFAVSAQPTAGRGADTVLRVMDSQGKTKIGYVSFAVASPDTTTLAATLILTPRQSGFTIQVRNVGAFNNATTFTTRPELGAVVGQATTTAGQRLAIPLAGVQATGGRVHLALTTSSPYELEVVSREGATGSGPSDAVPTLQVGAPTSPPPGPSTPTPPQPGWRLAFADEFDGTAVDTSVWTVYDEAKGHSVESPKTATCPLASNVRVTDGILVMRTQKADGACRGGQAQSGAGLNTWGTFQQAGGRFEVRGRWTHQGNYLWGGFWTHGNGGYGWSKDNPSEIDVWEYIGKDAEPNLSRYKPAIHYNYTCEGTCGMQNLPYTGYDVTRWHTYAVEWDATDPSDPTTMQIRFYLDDVLITLFDKAGTWRVDPDGTRVLAIAGGWQNPKGAFPNPFGFDRPQQLILSAWVGAPGADPATVAAGYRPTGGHADLEIDYVRVYKR